MNNVHEDAPVVFESKWALSYLRGPRKANITIRLVAMVSATYVSSTSEAATPAW
jgi:hypothetical protein